MSFTKSKEYFPFLFVDVVTLSFQRHILWNPTSERWLLIWGWLWDYRGQSDSRWVEWVIVRRGEAKLLGKFCPDWSAPLIDTQRVGVLLRGAVSGVESWSRESLTRQPKTLTRSLRGCGQLIRFSWELICNSAFALELLNTRIRREAERAK